MTLLGKLVRLGLRLGLQLLLGDNNSVMIGDFIPCQ